MVSGIGYNVIRCESEGFALRLTELIIIWPSYCIVVAYIDVRFPKKFNLVPLFRVYMRPLLGEFSALSCLYAFLFEL